MTLSPIVRTLYRDPEAVLHYVLLTQHAFHLEAPELPTPYRAVVSGTGQGRVLCQPFLKSSKRR